MSHRVNFEVPDELMQRVVDALDAQGLHVIEYVKSGGFRYRVSSCPPVVAGSSMVGNTAGKPLDFVPRFLRQAM